MSARIRMVCFDWGGVILRICRSWAEGCAVAGLPVRGEPAEDRPVAARRAISHEFQIGRIGVDDYLARLSDSFSGAYTPEECRRVHDAWLLHEYPGVAALIDSLASLQNVETGLLSNTNELHWARAAPNGELPHFPAINALAHRHASHLLGLAKPGVEIYRAFERETARAPAEILFFDDLPENIDAARAAGWRAERIDHAGDTAAQLHAHLLAYGVLPPA